MLSQRREAGFECFLPSWSGLTLAHKEQCHCTPATLVGFIVLAAIYLITPPPFFDSSQSFEFDADVQQRMGRIIRKKKHRVSEVTDGSSPKMVVCCPAEGKASLQVSIGRSLVRSGKPDFLVYENITHILHVFYFDRTILGNFFYIKGCSKFRLLSKLVLILGLQFDQ